MLTTEEVPLRSRIGTNMLNSSCLFGLCHGTRRDDRWRQSDPSNPVLAAQRSRARPKPMTQGRYEGDFVNGKRSGHGKIYYPDGSIFEGEFANGEQKEGELRFTSGTVYSGEFVGSQPHGQGSVTYASSASYVGSFAKGLKEGFGTFTSSDGSRYEGEWSRDAVTGIGRMAYADGRCYDGQWENGLRHGQGMCTYPNGSTYVGAWDRDERVGFGTMYHADKSSYKGEWAESQPHGRGAYVFSNGDYFTGEWCDGKRQGQGKYEFGKFDPSDLPRPPSKQSLVFNKRAELLPVSETTTAMTLPAPPVGPRQIAVVSGAPEHISGVYKALRKPGAYGERVYEKQGLFLYHVDGDSHYAIGRKKNGPTCICFTSHQNASAKGRWKLYDQGQWVVASNLCARFLEEDDEVEGEADAVALTSRFSNISGGYLREDRRENGRPVYYNREDAKYLWYGPNKAWMVSDSAGVTSAGSYSSFVASEPGLAQSPELADWSKQGVNVRSVQLPGGKNDPSSALAVNDPRLANLFRDAAFPAAPRSIGSEPMGGVRPEDAAWIRPAFLHPEGEPIELFNGIDPNDIMQGALGDCWLLSAISAIAEFPSFVEDNLFVTKEMSPIGKYELRIYDASLGRFKVVTVDDQIPCGPPKWWEPPRPLFAQPQQHELYVLIIEKCFAKLAGCYDLLVGGYPLLAWMVMTGCEDLQSWKRLTSGPRSGEWQLNQVAIDKVREEPFNFQQLYTRVVDNFKSDPSLFEFLAVCDERNYIMAASISGSTIEKARKDGLVERHAYSLIAVKSSSSFQLVQLRNPWGNDREWNGKWSDGSSEWDTYPKVKRDLEYDEVDDGAFWMDFKDFTSIFDGIQICAIEMPSDAASSYRR